MKNKQRPFTVLIFFVAIAFLGLKLDLRSTQLGHYRGEAYNFFSTIYEEPILDRTLLIANVPASLVQAYGAQGINLNTVALDTADIKIWGPVLEIDLAPADRIYNVVFHPDVQRWRASDADFNINLMVGLFDPNGVVQPATEGDLVRMPFNTFENINVNKHDQIYYSPNNGRFQIMPGRKIASFWTAALSQDRTKTVIAFNVIIDDQATSAAIGDIASDSEISDDDAIAQIGALIARDNAMSPADKEAMGSAAALIQRLNGMVPAAQPERADNAGQEADDEAMARRMEQEELERDRADQELARRLEQEEQARRQAQQRAQQEQAEQAQAEALRAAQAREEQERASQQAAALARIQEEARLAREQEARQAQEAQQRAERERQEAADQEMARRIEQEELERDHADQELARRLEQEAREPQQGAITSAPAPQPQRSGQKAGQQALSRQERIAREQAAEEEAMNKLLKRNK